METEGGHTILPPGVLATYPLIQLQGNSKVVLEHYPIIPSKDGRYAVRYADLVLRLIKSVTKVAGLLLPRPLALLILCDLLFFFISATLPSLLLKDVAHTRLRVVDLYKYIDTYSC